MDTSKSVVFVVFISLVLDLIAFTMILPLLPSLLDYYAQQDDHVFTAIYDAMATFRRLLSIPDTPRWNSVLLGGMIGSLFSFLQYLSSPLVGALSDVYGRKSVLVISMLGTLVSYCLFAISTSFTVFLLSRVVAGLCKGNTSLCIAACTDVTDRSTRGKAMALVGISYSLGFLIGPLLGAGFARLIRLHPHMFFQAPALAGVIITAINIFLLVSCLHETLPTHKRLSSVGARVVDMTSYVNPSSLFCFSRVKMAAQGQQSLRTIGWVYFLFLFLFSGVEFTLTFLVHERFNYDSMQQGKMFFVMGTIMAVVQGGYVRRLRPGSELNIAQMGILSMMISFLITGCSSTIVVFYLGLALFAVGAATVVPCLTTAASQHGREDEKGTVLGIFRSLGALARAAGPIAACSIYWCFGPITCYVVAMLALLLPLVLLRHNALSQSADKLHMMKL